MDDTFIIWHHGKDKLDIFLKYLNSLSDSINFTMEVEDNNILPFLDILISRNHDGSISHQVYRKKTRTEKYLHANSHHHQTQKLGVLNSLETRVVRILDHDHFEQDKNPLMGAFEKNGYKINQVIKEFKISKNCARNKLKMDDIITKVHLPYILSITDKISHILKKKNI